METVNLDNLDLLDTAGHSSKGNQLKWRQGEIWYKADHMGYEGLAEVVVSRLLLRSSAENFVHYDPVLIQYGGREYRGCQSRNFLHPDEELITVDRLFRLYTGRSVTKELAAIPSIRERIVYLVENVIEFTGLETFGQYLTTALELDAFFLNEDRHTNNIAVLRCAGEDRYRLCPYFDHGLSLYSDMTTDFGLDQSLMECRKKVEAKPFSRDFDEQMDEAESLYGNQLVFHFDSKDIQRELKLLEGIYEKPVLSRVEEVLNQQKHKYEYFWHKIQ